MSLAFRTLLLASLATLALAATAVPAMGESATAQPAGEAAAAAGTEQPPTMSIAFTKRKATLVGARAMVYVKCTGFVSHSCVGTLSLQAAGGAHKVPFSIERGERQILAVPLGNDCDGGKARAVASTVQLSGTSVGTTSVLRLG
jgi:hypothetical protein